MNQTLNTLLETMTEETAQYRDMHAILAQEREAATRSNRDQLMQIAQAKQRMVQMIAHTERRRQTLVGELAGRYGIDDQPLTVGKLCTRLDAPDANRLTALAHELKGCVETVQRENNANARLFSQALELVHGSLKMLNELIYSHTVYAKPGSEQRPSGYGGGRGRVFCSNV